MAWMFWKNTNDQGESQCNATTDGYISSSVDQERRRTVEGEKLQLHKKTTLLHIELYTLCAS